MAEVPEVEILVRDLCQVVVGRVISSADNLLLAVHFMRWGTLKLTPVSQPLAEETLINFHLDQDEDLRLLDKLGYARSALGPPEILEERLDLCALGPEALDPSFTVEVLARQLSRRRGILKTVLLNQRVLAGLGNRDADESLWVARLDPRRPASSLMPEEMAGLHAAIGQVLDEGIALRGTQRDLFGQPGKARHRRHPMLGFITPHAFAAHFHASNHLPGAVIGPGHIGLPFEDPVAGPMFVQA